MSDVVEMCSCFPGEVPHGTSAAQDIHDRQLCEPVNATVRMGIRPGCLKSDSVCRPRAQLMCARRVRGVRARLRRLPLTPKSLSPTREEEKTATPVEMGKGAGSENEVRTR